jgi:beta-N-acetylhexosaminidase
MERMNRVELPPFEAAIAAGVASIMTAHVLFTQMDDKYPATLSRAVLDGLLRKRMKFDRVLMSDDMQMKAIADHYGFDEAIVLGAKAGVDLFWVCHSAELQNRAIDVLIKAAESGQLSQSRLEEANRRIDALFAHFVKPGRRGKLSAELGSPEHQSVVQELLKRVDAAALAETRDPTNFM